MNKRILVADDEKRIRILISDFLKNEGYEVIEASDGKEALDLFFYDQPIHMVILDVMMPQFTGIEVCEEIRKSTNVPIIMLTAKNAEKDELNGFEKGADEYIKKPFSLSVLGVRVNAIMNRAYQYEDYIERGDLKIYVKKHVVKYFDEIIDLSYTEYKLLTYMIENEGTVLTRDMLLNNVWGYDYDGTDRTIDSHINRLRIKLKNSGDYIKTVRGYGYKFEVV